jgi:hypothetical protein
MRQAIIFLVLLTGPAAFGYSGIELGIRGGAVLSYNQSGLQLAKNSPGGQALIGGQIYMTDFPVVNLIAAIDYSWKEKSSSYSGQTLTFRARDMAVTISAVYPIRAASLTAYVGGGIGSHSISYAYRRPADLSFATYGMRIPEASTYFGYHGLIGARAPLPHLPVGFFVEGRLTRVCAPDGNIRYGSCAVGLYLPLP